MSESLKKLHVTLTDKKNKLRERRELINKHKDKLTALFSDLEAIGCDPYTDGDWIFIPLSGDKVKFLSFARIKAKHGFRVPKVEKGATGFSELEMLDDLPLYFNFQSTQCRRVKVGTRTVEQDVFETVCDEFMPYEGVTPPTSQPVTEESIQF